MPENSQIKIMNVIIWININNLEWYSKTGKHNKAILRVQQIHNGWGIWFTLYGFYYMNVKNECDSHIDP